MIDIYILVIIILVLYVHFVIQWLSSKNYNIYEWFENKCDAKSCNLKLINIKIANVSNFIQFLNDRIEILEDAIIQFGPIKIKEDYQNCFDKKTPYTHLYVLEKQCNDILDKQNYIKNLLNKVYKRDRGLQTGLDLPERTNNASCFVLKTCDFDKLNNEIKNVYIKIDEIKYRTDYIYDKLKVYEKMYGKMIKNRNKAINAVGQDANKQMAQLFGVPVDLKVDKHLKKGIDKQLIDDISKNLENGDIDAIRNSIIDMVINDTTAAKVASKSDSNKTSKNLDKANFTKGNDKTKKQGANLVQNNINTTDDEEAKEKAQKGFGSAKDDTGVPSGFV